MNIFLLQLEITRYKFTLAHIRRLNQFPHSTQPETKPQIYHSIPLSITQAVYFNALIPQLMKRLTALQSHIRA